MKDALVKMAFGLGENHVADESAMPAGFAKRITDFDISDQGVLHARGAFADTGFAAAHSVFVNSAGATFAFVPAIFGFATAVSPGVWEGIASSGAATLQESSRRIWYAESTGVIYASNGEATATIRTLPDGGGYLTHRWGMEQGSVDAVVWGSDDELPDTLSYLIDDLTGEESGAWPCSRESAPNEFYGITKEVVEAAVEAEDPVDGEEAEVEPPSLLAGDGGMEFRTSRGSALYRHRGLESGRICTTQGQLAFLPCVMLLARAGRIWGVAGVDGDMVYFTPPMRPGYYDPAFGYFHAPEKIMAFGAVSDGMFVVTATSVYFVKGFDPEKIEFTKVSSAGGFYGSQVYVPAEIVDAKVLGMSPGADMLFAWLGKNGVCFGLPGGEVRVPGAATINLPAAQSEVVGAVITRHGFKQLVFSTL